MLVLLRRRLYAFPALFDHIPVAQWWLDGRSALWPYPPRSAGCMHW